MLVLGRVQRERGKARLGERTRERERERGEVEVEVEVTEPVWTIVIVSHTT